MILAIGVVVFWLTLVLFFSLRALMDDEDERRKREFLDQWED